MTHRIIIAGGRDFDDYGRVCDAMFEMQWNEDECTIVSGGARGADTLGEQFAEDYGFELETHAANWKILGKKAGIMRNLEMAQLSQVLVAFWDGKSKGTRHMIDAALEAGLEVHVYRY